MADSTETSGGATAIAGTDAIDQLAGIRPGSALAELRAQRPEAMRHAQGSFGALLAPDDLAGVSQTERELIALRVAVLTPSPAVAAAQRERLRQLGTDPAAIAAVEHFPEAAGLSPREVAILRFVDRLTLEPAAATPEHIADLKAAGLGPRDIVTIAQLISFLSFEVRVLAGLRLLAEES